MQYSITICSPLEVVGDVLSRPFVTLQNSVNHGLKCFQEIRLKIVGDATFHSFFFHGNFQLEVANDVVVATVVEEVGINIYVKVAHSR